MVDSLDEFDAEMRHFNQIYPRLGDGITSDYFSVDEFSERFVNSAQHLKLMHMNARSLFPKIDEFKVILASLQVDFNIICFSETWLTIDNVEFVEFPNFRHYYSVRGDGRRGGGVSIFVGSSIKCCALTDLFFHSFECVFVKCTVKNKSCIIGVIYRPPNSNIGEFFGELNILIGRLDKIKNCMKIICGDFNLDLLKTAEGDGNSLNFMNVMISSSLLPLIAKPTRVTDNGFSLIDNIFSSNPSAVSGIIPTDLSDHYLIFSVFENFFIDSRFDDGARSIKYRKLDEFAMESLYDSLSTTDFATVFSCESVNIGVLLLTL